MNAVLLNTQTAFQEFLLAGTPGIADAMRPSPGISVERRLGIYHHAYRARLVDALRDAFERTAAYLGDDWFDADALAFVEATPSSAFSLNDYGRELPEWLAARHRQDGDIAELAALDWALRRAFDGADAPVLELAALGAVAPEAWARVVLQAQPTARLLTVRHNTLAIWAALDQGQAPPRAEALPAPLAVLVWRRGEQPHFRSLGELEAMAVAALLRGASFAELCGEVAAAFPQADMTVEAGTLLRRWIDDGLIARVTDPAA